MPADNRYHILTSQAIEHAAAALHAPVKQRWISTAELEHSTPQKLANFHALWIAPGSPYTSMDGALAAIRFARESHVPLLGTCGGFQHIILEYARNVLGFVDASHGETDPYASALFISRLRVR